MGGILAVKLGKSRISSHVWVETSTSKRLVVSGRWWRSQAMSLTPPPMPLARAPGRGQPPHSLSQALHRASCSLQPRGMVKGDFASSSQENIHHVFLLSSLYCPQHSSFMGEPSGISHFRWFLLTHSLLLDLPESSAQAQKTKGSWILFVLFHLVKSHCAPFHNCLELAEMDEPSSFALSVLISHSDTRSWFLDRRLILETRHLAFYSSSIFHTMATHHFI